MTPEVRCPKCGGHALFHEPFEFLRDPPKDAPAHRWGGWHVVEKFSQILPWKAPSGSSQYLVSGPGDGEGYRLMHRGVVACAACKGGFVHTLAWPDDAWWQWSIRGQMLWAWDRPHAEQILAYVRATDRPPRPTHGPLGSLPSHFLAAKARGAVVKVIERKLTTG